MNIESVGAVAFGLVVGWITYRTLRRTATTASISDIAAVIGAVGGAAVTGLFTNPSLFGWYSIGLAVGFFVYIILGATVWKDIDWLSVRKANDE